MSLKTSTSGSATTDSQCQHVSPKGQRCLTTGTDEQHMLIDENHRSPQGTGRPTLCPCHAGRLRATVPTVEPEVLAADLLGDIHDFSTPGSVNLFLGNLVKQLAGKRIARRDAIALAYISQLLLNSFPALERAAAAEKKARKKGKPLASTFSFASKPANVPHVAFNNPPITPWSFALTEKRP